MPHPPYTIYVATSDQHVWRTTDNGVHWSLWDYELFGIAQGPILAFCVDPGNPTHVFAVGGQYWGTLKVWELGPFFDTASPPWMSRSGPANLNVYALAIDWQYDPPCLFVATDRGVYSSVNQGNAWSYFGVSPALSVTLPKVQVNDLQVTRQSPTTSILAAATWGRGVFEILIAPSTISGSASREPSRAGRPRSPARSCP